MALTPGGRIGVYQIIAGIGVGGMGEVYRATDTTLGRQVAIKILPNAFASDPDRVARFEREAKTLASLNHPHIAAIYGLSPEAVQFFHCDHALAIKASIPRPTTQGDVSDSDGHGGQQYAPLMDLEIP